ncbi:MarR family winged helix-turn-helix transcriptional regulator [Clostridium sp.]
MQELNEENKSYDSIEVAKLFLSVMGLFKQNIIKSFEETGITAPQAMLMGILSKEKKMKISELSNKLGLSNSTVSGIVDRLEKQGIVERERSHEDRRVVYVNICTKFNEVHGDAHKLIRENTANVMKKATPEEINKIVEGLSILKKILVE